MATSSHGVAACEREIGTPLTHIPPNTRVMIVGSGLLIVTHTSGTMRWLGDPDVRALPLGIAEVGGPV